ncbi:MAG: arsenate reductase (glutaredoxin) [Candidatus Competibacteraceae bacterium]|nr:arsenate reductase (glutaredoxin) [Candidatus Competibacteraceae bacterium]
MKQPLRILHNPRCGKSRKALEALQQHGHNPLIVEYLKQPLSHHQIKEICRLLNIRPALIIRKKEPAYALLFNKSSSYSEAQYIDAMSNNPILIERPIVISQNKAWLIRTDDALQALLSELS